MTAAEFLLTHLRGARHPRARRRRRQREGAGRHPQSLPAARRMRRGKRVVLVVDEAQNLSPELLEQVRLLTNLETETQKLLQIILIGQPELRDVLARNDLRQLAQRITGRYHLDPLSRDESVRLREASPAHRGRHDRTSSPVARWPSCIASAAAYRACSTSSAIARCSAAIPRTATRSPPRWCARPPARCSTGASLAPWLPWVLGSATRWSSPARCMPAQSLWLKDRGRTGDRNPQPAQCPRLRRLPPLHLIRRLPRPQRCSRLGALLNAATHRRRRCRLRTACSRSGPRAT